MEDQVALRKGMVSRNKPRRKGDPTHGCSQSMSRIDAVSVGALDQIWWQSCATRLNGIRAPSCCSEAGSASLDFYQHEAVCDFLIGQDR